jgi:8-oxo-dGTP pyrophosphatase MutT (NUDIX family)
MKTFKQDLQKKLSAQPSSELTDNLSAFACVAVLLRGSQKEDLEIAYIERAQSPDDRWSGQLAFPGGRHEECDANALATALRETQEEIGLALNPSDLIGRLNDVQARRRGALLDFFIRPYVFHLDNLPEGLQLDPAEVADFFWLPLKELSNPDRATDIEIKNEGLTLKLPAVNVDRDVPLWGLTYLMTQDLLHRL